MSGAYPTFSDLVGTTLVSCEQIGRDVIQFVTDDGRTYRLFHSQDCCESVEVEDVCGDLSDLIGSPIVQAEEAESHDAPKAYAESHTWTFYKLATNKGSVTIRWYGESNGYYSESVDFALVFGQRPALSPSGTGGDHVDDDPDDDDLFDAEEECGGYTNGRFSWADCRLAGTEFCDFECPNGYRARAALAKATGTGGAL